MDHHLAAWRVGPLQRAAAARGPLVRITAAILIAVGLLASAACRGEPGPGGARGAQINGAGATFPYPIYSRWFAEYNRLHPEVRINYQSLGSGAGIRLGMANAVAGSIIVTLLGAGFAIPIGILSGIYAAEYAGTRLASAVRFAADTLNGVPSIVIGVFVYSVAVLPFRQFSALAGGLALGIMMIPLIMRTTEELLRLVPSTLREGALALGATRGRAVFTVVVPAALPGILTGILLALSRIAGETAPLLFTAFNNRFWSTDVTQPIATLTVQVFTYAIAPYDDWHRQAWAGALVLVVMVLGCSLLARLATARMERMQRGG
jgi:phosphate transport system permease protein